MRRSAPWGRARPDAQLLPSFRQQVLAFTSCQPDDHEAFETVHKQVLVALQQVVRVLEDAIAVLDGKCETLGTPNEDQRFIDLVLEQLDTFQSD